MSEKISNAKIEEYLKEFISGQSSPKFAVLLDGRWGSGKTHFVKSFFENNQFGESDKVYVSLFGISSIESIQTSLFFASASKSERMTYQSVNVVGNVIKGMLRFDLTGDDNPDGQLNFDLGPLSKLISDNAKKLSNAVIVLDDLERCKVPPHELFGFLNSFVEHGDTRLILVANLDKLDPENDKAIQELQEKLVGHEFKLYPDFSSAFDQFSSECDDPNLNRVLQRFKPKIQELFYQSKFQNLRALRQFIWHLFPLIRNLRPDFQKNDYLLEKLISEFFVFFFEFKLDLSGSGLQPEGLRSKYSSENRVVYALQPQGDEAPSAKYVALKKYGTGFDTVLTVETWIKILTTGIIDSRVVNEEISESKPTQSQPPWERLLLYVKQDYSSENSRNQFKTDLNHVLWQIGSGQKIYPGEILQIAGLLLEFSRDGLIDCDKAIIKLLLVDYIDQTILPEMNYDKHKTFHYLLNRGVGHGGYVLSADTDFDEFKTTLKRKIDSWFDDWLQTQAPDQLMDTLIRDHKEFCGELNYVQGYNRQRYVTHPILSSLSVSEFVSAWLSLDRESEMNLIPLLENRYTNKQELYQAEAPWWESVIAELRVRADQEDYTPRKAQILFLAKSILRQIFKI